MSLWIFYFLAKFFLYSQAFIALHFASNLALALYAFPVRMILEKLFPNRTTRVAHAIVGAILAFWVLWSDTYFPSLSTSFRFVASPETRPSLSYTLSFLTGYWNPMVVIALAVLLAAAIGISRKKIAVWPLIIVAIIGIGVTEIAKKPRSLEEEIAHFYSDQAKSKHNIKISAPSEKDAPFDIVILHVCSMSWDDLNRLGLRKNPLFSRFDTLLTKFNTVTSYSNPSALRLLRAQCGQIKHLDLYKAFPEECNLFASLKNAGFETATVFNHDGPLTKTMESDLQRWTNIAPPADRSKLQPEAYSFDNSPIYGNYSALETWAKNREASGAKRAALYYNTVTLHGGAHWVSDTTWWKKKHGELYLMLARKLFDDLSRFFDLLEQSKRNTLVVMVAEHGAAVAATRIQAGDLRDIPLPPITLVPAAFRFIKAGETPAPRAARLIETPTSYQTIASVIQSFIKNPSPSDPNENVKVVETPFLAENELSQVAMHQGKYFFREKEKAWAPLTDELLSVTNASELGVISEEKK